LVSIAKYSPFSGSRRKKFLGGAKLKNGLVSMLVSLPTRKVMSFFMLQSFYGGLSSPKSFSGGRRPTPPVLLPLPFQTIMGLHNKSLLHTLMES